MDQLYKTFLRGFCFIGLISITSSCLFGQITYTFTSGGATGTPPPTQGMIDAAYTGTTLDGAVTVTNGIQYWIVPITGMYQIEAYGGQGYGTYGGRGAQMIGVFQLNAGETLKILVGQRAGDYFQYPGTAYNHQFGGGGGTFVTLLDNTPLIIAGGGGGSHATAFVSSCDGQTTPNGANGVNATSSGAGGTAGNGGGAGIGPSNPSCGGGGGLLTNGGGGAGGQAYVNGGAGGSLYGFGGFGGGGGTNSWNNYRSAGGGGYSGGGGTWNSDMCCPSGGGGGSYNAGTYQNNLAGVQIGNGMVIIRQVDFSLSNGISCHDQINVSLNSSCMRHCKGRFIRSKRRTG